MPVKVTSFEEAARFGFNFSAQNPREWIKNGNVEKLAADAALVTTPNTLVPAEFSAYIDPQVVDILTAPRAASAVFSEAKKGDWGTSYSKFGVMEFTGQTTPYTDYSEAATSGVNMNWVSREQYRFQTNIHYGDLESALASTAKIDLAAQKQRAAAEIIATDANKFYVYGVAGKNIYGLINDPNLPATLTPAQGTGGSRLWSSKTTQEIFNDILALYQALLTQSAGIVDMDSDLVLVVPHTVSVNLAKATDYNVSVMDMINGYFTNGRLKIETLPELHSATAGDTVMMIARKVRGQETANLGFSEKYRSGRVVPHASSFTQKISASTYGCIYYRYFPVARMLGV